MKYYCIKCKSNITNDEYHYSSKNFGKPLCRTHQPTLEARKLGKKLEQIGNWNVVYESFDGYKSVDISIPSAKVEIEVDGLQHAITKDQALSDIKRAYYSYKKKGIITLHVPNILIKNDDTIDEVATYINEFLNDNYDDVKDNVIIKFLKRIFK